MPIELTVAEIRRRLLAEQDAQTLIGDGSLVIAEVGGLFHEVVAKFFSVGSPLYAVNVLEDVEPTAAAWRSALIDAAYRAVVAPRLERDRAIWSQFPHHFGKGWRAIENLCGWLADLLLQVRMKQGSLDTVRDLADCERVYRFELQEPGWANGVVVEGSADALLRMSEAEPWCVLVFDVGAAPWTASLVQAVLYRLLLKGDTRGGVPRQVKIVGFAGGVREQVVGSAELEQAEGLLRAAIGRIAGVDRAAPAFPMSLEWKQVTPTHQRMQERLLRVLKAYGLDATIDEPPRLGPTFMRFLVTPAVGVKVSRFKKLVEEIALGMNLKNLPLVDRAGGRIAVDIERPDRCPVRFDDLRHLLPAMDQLYGNSRMLVGVDIDGLPVFVDLARPEHCHVLVVGTAGSGKSIWMRAAIASLVETNVPATLQLVLIDPKRNAFTAWRASPFLRERIVFPDETSPVAVLNGLIDEMESRYKRMAEAEVDDLRGLIRHDKRSTPRIVCACDEYADLVMTSDDRRDIEDAITRLGAKARAAGIHLILATQTPRREIIGGTIKANLPTCVGLRVSSEAEAKIIEIPGADLLLGHGDLLLRSIGMPRRLQGALMAAGEKADDEAEVVPATMTPVLRPVS